MADQNQVHNHPDQNMEELEMKASMLENSAREIAEKIEYLSNQLSELEEFRESLEFLSKSEESSSFSSIGRGVYAKSSIDPKTLFVNVGAGVILKKSHNEVKEIIESQIRQFHEAKVRLMAQIEVFNGMLSSLSSIRPSV